MCFRNIVLLAFADSFDLALLKFWGLIDLVLGFFGFSLVCVALTGLGIFCRFFNSSFLSLSMASLLLFFVFGKRLGF